MQVVAYVGLKCLQGGTFSSGILNGLRSFLWIQVQQHTNRSVQVSDTRSGVPFDVQARNILTLAGVVKQA